MACSREQRLKNLKKARGWRSPEESRLVRMFIWKWLLGRGPNCSSYALMKWLGVSRSYIPTLKKTLPLDPVEFQRELECQFEREVAQGGPPTVEALREARIKSRSMRAKGRLRVQPRWKEINEPIIGRPKSIPTKPSPVTLVLDGKIPLEPPGPAPKPHYAWSNNRKRKRRYKKTPGKGCSGEQAWANLKKGRPPRRWRSPAEARLVRMFVWQWLLGRGPECSQYALARWLGVNEAYIRDLRKKLPVDPVTGPAKFLREVGRSGVPTLEALARARAESRRMRDWNLLRTQRAYKAVKCEFDGRVHYVSVHTKPNNVTAVLDELTPLRPPTAKLPPRTLGPGNAEPDQVGLSKAGNDQATHDEFSAHMWQLRMSEERKRKVQPVMRRRRRR